MPDRDFLEKYPLYRKLKIDLPVVALGLEMPAVHMPCLVCDSEQTFVSKTNYRYNVTLAGRVIEFEYCCASCQKFWRRFFIKFSPENDYVMKVGQEPPWEITPDRTLEKALGSRSAYYKKGLVCESQNYGIGAFAYYRRIVEEIIDELLAGVANLITGEERKIYLEALEKVKKTTITQEKIDLVKDLLPPILRPDGMNPLSTLHSILSEGLHGQTDEHCIELAMTIREVLIFLVNQVTLAQTSTANFTENMRKILEHKKKAA
jgi:hypothetical protein